MSDGAPIASPRPREVIISVRGLKVGFGDHLVMDGLDLDLYRGEVLGFVGASGAGKSVLTRTILGLIHKQAGTIEVFGHNIDKLTPREHLEVGERWGVLFQEGALFSSLTVRQNIQAPMREHLQPIPVNARRSGGAEAGARRLAPGNGRQACLPSCPAA